MSIFESTINKSLSSYKRVKLINIPEKYSDQKILKHVETSNNGYIWVDNDTIIAVLSINQKEDNQIWIQALEVLDKYRGNGFGKELLDIAVKEFNANYLSVNKKNALAKRMYDKYGFKVYKETEYMYFMCLKQSINENMFFNKKDMKKNLDNWGIKENQDNILYITGFSGSGKTTLSKDYASKYNAEILSLDNLDFIWDGSLKDRFILKAFKKFPEYKSVLVRCKSIFIFSSDKDYNTFKELWPQVVKFIIDEMHKEKRNLFIIEGIQILYDNFPADLNNVPAILKGTSGIKSFVGRTIRKNNGEFVYNDFKQDFKTGFKGLVIRQDSPINKLRNAWVNNKPYVNKNLVTESTEIIQESYKSNRKYSCPFCTYKNIRQKLIYHIEKHHKDMIPENYSAGRLLYDMINTNPNKGKCRICGKPTEWNENKLRYEVFCSNPKCKKAYSDEFHKIRMVNIYGVESLLDDPAMQAKMIKNRKISGYYQFQDGAKISYCGQYEKKLLEFLDQVMNYSSYDITSPGPVIEYEYEGKKHTWITDQYIGPANLVIDCKDGGDNPNNRPMKEYRDKQKAKEQAIAKTHKYNYLRLTNNDFSQLIETLMDIKYQLMENPILLDNPIININEDAGLAASPVGNAMVGTGKVTPYVIAFKPIDSVFTDDTDYALTFDKSLDDIYTINNEGYIEKKGIDFLFDKKFNIIKSESNIEFQMDDKQHDRSYFYELALKDNKNYEYEDNIYEDIYLKSQINCESIIYNCDDGLLSKLSEINEMSTDIDFVKIRNDINGYFLYNNKSNLRTKSYDTISEAMNTMGVISTYKMEDII